MATSKIVKRKRARAWVRIRSWVLILFGLFLTLSGSWMLLRTPSLSFGNGTFESSQSHPDTSSIPTHIEIKSAAIDLPIRESTIIGGKWQTPPDTAAHLSSSGRIGHNTNIVIYGHNTGNIFAKLHLLQGSEIITLTDTRGQKHIYKVTDIRVVDPDQVSEVAPTPEEVLTIYTCTGRFDLKRLVVKAIPWEKVVEGLI